MIPLTVTARLACGFVAMDPWTPMLDSLLGYEVLRRQLGPAFYEQDPHRDGLIEPDLPLERRGSGDSWYWAASGPQYAELTQYLRHWHKRFDDAHALDFADTGKARKVSTASGRYKNWRVPLVCRLSPEIVWHCVGDPAAILDLVMGVTHLGKKIAQGMGAVLGWEVTSAAEDWSERREGRVLRPLPVPECFNAVPGVHVGEVAIRPPYWWLGHRRRCVLPGSATA